MGKVILVFWKCSGMDQVWETDKSPEPQKLSNFIPFWTQFYDGTREHSVFVVRFAKGKRCYSTYFVGLSAWQSVRFH